MTINNNNNIVSNNIDQNQNILASSPVINTYPQADASTNFNYQMNNVIHNKKQFYRNYDKLYDNKKSYKKNKK